MVASLVAAIMLIACSGVYWVSFQTHDREDALKKLHTLYAETDLQGGVLQTPDEFQPTLHFRWHDVGDTILVDNSYEGNDEIVIHIIPEPRGDGRGNARKFTAAIETYVREELPDATVVVHRDIAPDLR
jgi:hypothetical protein